MVLQRGKQYVVKRRNKRFTISKEDLKKKNVELVVEYKTASADRRGEILNEYFELNRSFVNYFPKFFGNYRDEIINIFVSMWPEAFMNFDPARDVDVNSYLSMFVKKHAIREFLYLDTTVQYNKFIKDEDGKSKVIKAKVVSLDGFASNGSGDYLSDYDGSEGETNAAEAYFLEDYYRQVNADGDEAWSEGIGSYSHHFKGQAREVVKDFENGLRWNEVLQKSGLTTDRFISLLVAIRLQIQRILKEEGKDVRFVTKAERRARRAVSRADRRRFVERFDGYDGGSEEAEALEVFRQDMEGGAECPEDEESP